MDAEHLNQGDRLATGDVIRVAGGVERDVGLLTFVDPLPDAMEEHCAYGESSAGVDQHQRVGVAVRPELVLAAVLAPEHLAEIARRSEIEVWWKLIAPGTEIGDELVENAQ